MRETKEVGSKAIHFLSHSLYSIHPFPEQAVEIIIKYSGNVKEFFAAF